MFIELVELLPDKRKVLFNLNHIWAIRPDPGVPGNWGVDRELFTRFGRGKKWTVAKL
jgi:hypothetical protein